MGIGDALEWRADYLDDQGGQSTCNSLFVLDHVHAQPYDFTEPLHLIQFGRLINGETGEEPNIQIYEGIGWVIGSGS